jgi:hypothetical protein
MTLVERGLRCGQDRKDIGMDQPLSPDDIAVQIEQAAETGDLAALRRLADAGSQDALDQLVESAAEQEDFDELRRLADAGNQDAADILAEQQGETAD